MRYYGVIGNRDYIKISGLRRPYWEFLDQQPDGWLTSLIYSRSDLPAAHMIFDCGAWSYKHEDQPKYPPQVALSKYRQQAKRGDFLIAPDHMILREMDWRTRHAVNMHNAKSFISACGSTETPMAVVHGLTIDQRLDNAQELMHLGYSHLAIGGVAAKASSKQMVIAMIAGIREATKGAWVHVLGLSSPDFCHAWQRIGIDSCDGSSHFKQAFTAGAFFVIEQDKLRKYQASRPGEPIVAPVCDCSACVILRDEGIDTRQYGSNENNMGRAAHNQNLLMRAQQIAMRKTLVLVACCKEKLTHPAPARSLYTSSLFRKSATWAESNGHPWAILSAKHGVVHPDQIIEPYDQSLNNMTPVARHRWDRKVENQLMSRTDLQSHDKLVVLAGKNYLGFVPLVPFATETPLEGLGIGERLRWLNNNTQTQLRLL